MIVTKDAEHELCHLCGGPGPLRQSHGIPKFVFAWMKKTGSQYLRAPISPNVRLQDGRKEKLLCEGCEQRFSRDEKWFSSNVFHNYLADTRRSFDYGPELYFFLLSVLWRIVTRDSRDASSCWHGKLVAVESDWRRALLGRAVPVLYPAIHLFLVDVTRPGSSIPVVNFNRYLARAVDATTGSNETRCFVYAKFSRFIILGPVTPFDPAMFVNTRVSAAGGRMVLPQEMRDGEVGEFMLGRARSFHEMRERGLSEVQRKVIAEDAKKNRRHLLASDLGTAILADAQSDVVPVVTGKIGRNDRCPCGSGTKYKRCHGR